MRPDDSRNLFCFVLGAGIGVVAGIVLAPASGELTRRRAYDFVTGTGRELYQRGQALADETAEWFEEGERLMGSDRA